MPLPRAGCKLHRCEPVRLVCGRSVLSFSFHASMIRRAAEDVLVQVLIAEPANEAFGKAILLRLARGDVVPAHPAILLPVQHRVRGQLRAIVADHRPGVAVLQCNAVELTPDTPARERDIRHQAQCVPRVVVHYRRNPEAPPIGQRVRDEVQRPALVRPGLS